MRWVYDTPGAELRACKRLQSIVPENERFLENPRIGENLLDARCPLAITHGESFAPMQGRPNREVTPVLSDTNRASQEATDDLCTRSTG